MLAPLRKAPSWPLACALAACLGALGCDDLERFSTASGESYCGAITLGGAFRTGFSPRVQMRLSLDATRLDGPDSPGALSTYETVEVRLLRGGAAPEGTEAVPDGRRMLFGIFTLDRQKNECGF